MSLVKTWLARQTPTDVVFLHDARQRGDMIYAAELEALVPDLAGRETWLCGPTGFMDTAEALISARSTAPLHREQFAAGRRASAHGRGAVQFRTSDIAASGG